MSDEYAGRSDTDIINEQAASLNSKSNYQTNDSFQPRTTNLSEESGVNESGIDSFPGAQVSTGRTGMTGGGTNAQNIPPEEGGLERSQVQGESSDRFEGEGQFGGADEKRRERLAFNPGGYDADARGIDQPYSKSKNEVIPITTGQELQPGQGLDADQGGQGNTADKFGNDY